MASTSANVTREYICDLCGVICKSQDDLNDHDSFVHPKQKVYTCNTCDYTSLNELNLASHIKDMHSSENTNTMTPTSASVIVRDYICDLCRVICRSQDDLNYHNSFVHPNEKVYTCNTCGYTSHYELKLASHIKDMHSLKKYYCLICDRTLVSKHRYIEHQDTHKFGNEFICTCNKVTNTFVGLICHYRKMHLSRDLPSDVIVNGRKGFKCNECEYINYHTRYDLTQHKLAMHSLETYICIICVIDLVSKYNYNQHQAEHKSLDHPDKFKCNVCNQLFTTFASLTYHYGGEHSSDDGAYVCNVCGVALAQDMLREHMNVHSRDYPYQCQICECRYRFLNTLDTHFRQYHTE